MFSITIRVKLNIKELFLIGVPCGKNANRNVRQEFARGARRGVRHKT